MGAGIAGGERLVPDKYPVSAEISGADFDAAWRKRVEAEIGKGLKVFLIDTDSLIASTPLHETKGILSRLAPGKVCPGAPLGRMCYI